MSRGSPFLSQQNPHPTSHIGVRENALDQASSHLDVINNFIKTKFRTGLIVIPTTPETLSHLNLWRKLHPSLIVVAPSTGGSHTPTELLNEFGKSTNAPILAIVFSDQLTSAQDAPILIKKKNKLFFISAIELIGQKKYATQLHVWLGQTVATLDGATPQIETLNFLADYLQNCEELGSEWLARLVQPHRYLDERRRDALRRLRLFQSMILHGSIKCPQSQKIKGTLERLITLQRSMTINDAS
ncbi:hypothetical protein [Xanthomonas campestris]|uniref:hypothetical protein n=1 Tax=Xanthomonas campestris TaxID=339 RepID=UPI001E463159|nr:hypothetical protein [Xanthomonas campestris]MCC4604625.1 hypothetical protein [Xanthomonas campestris pv. parthenii]